MKKYTIQYKNRKIYLEQGEIAYFINNKYNSYKLGESPSQIEEDIIKHFDSISSFEKPFTYKDIEVLGYTNK